MSRPKDTPDKFCVDCGVMVDWRAVRCHSCAIKASWAAKRAVLPNPNPSGLCLCNCGEPTRIADETCRKSGAVMGYPLRYINGHNNGAKPGDLSRYVINDRGCHVWQGATSRGYAMATINGKTTPVHIFLYEREHGPVPSGHELHHDCQLKRCINPDHVLPLTREEHNRITHGADARPT